MTPLAATFTPYGVEHLLLGVAFVLGCPLAALAGRGLRGRPQEQAVRRGLAVLMVAAAVPLQVTQLLPSEYDRGTSWPLQFCDLAWMIAAWALWTRDRRACWVLYYWALVLVPQAVLTPDLAEGFPHPRYLMFWGMHYLTTWAAVLLLGLGERPSWRGYRFAVAATAAWVVVLMTLNALAGTNYGFLNGKPAGGSVLDLMGPWPAYVVVEVVVVAAVWALITWPWTRAPGGARVGGTRRRKGAAGVPDPR